MKKTLILDVAGLELQAEERLIIQEPEVGGVILFARNYKNKQQLSALVQTIRQTNSELLITVDQEGGRVQRFKDGFVRLPSLQSIAQFASLNHENADDICHTLGWLMASEILSMDIDLSFAPVLDSDSHHCAAIGDRSFSEDADKTIRYAEAYIAGMNHAGMAATAKHFPGHGGVKADSHVELPTDQRTMDQLLEKDLKPFIALKHLYHGIMLGHLLFPQIDSHPVTFSPFWLKKIIRSDLAFNGLIFSDDLTMEGASIAGGYTERAQAALNAGCDMLLVCNNPQGAREVLQFLKQAKHKQEKQLQDDAFEQRLATMRKRKQITLQELQSSPLYKKACGYIEQIESL